MGDSDLLDLNQQCVTNLYMCLDNVTKYLDQNDQKEQINKLKKSLEVFCHIEATQSVADEALERAKSDTNASNIDSLQERYEAHLNSLTSKKRDLSKHAFMAEFKKRLDLYTQRNQQNLDDSDLAITQSDEQCLDPITKKPIQIAVKNKNCGHMYDQTSINQYINMKAKNRCPVAGCGNRMPITKNDLVTDDEFNFRMTINHHSTLAHQSVIEFDD